MPLAASALEKVSYRTNWFPQAEHGGWYQAATDGTYEKYGLEVEQEPGGPQVNNLQLLLAQIVKAWWVIIYLAPVLLRVVGRRLWP